MAGAAHTPDSPKEGTRYPSNPDPRCAPLPVDLAAESLATPPWPGADTLTVKGLTAAGATDVQKWEVEYPTESRGRYGNIEAFAYAKSADATFERVRIDICQVGRIDIVSRNGRLQNSPDWTAMDLPIALVTLRQAADRDLPRVLEQVSPDARAFVERILEEART